MTRKASSLQLQKSLALTSAAIRQKMYQNFIQLLRILRTRNVKNSGLTPSLQFFLEKPISSSDVCIQDQILEFHVLLGVGVEMDRVLGSKWLLNELSHIELKKKLHTP